MAKATKTAEKTQTEAPAPQQAPAAQPIAVQDQRMNWQGFEAELSKRENEIAMMLPAHVSPAKFHACAVAAVKQNPELLECTMRSLFSAITKSAQDGILPDGREGVINIYNTKISKPNEKPERWAKAAQWNPMAYGLRKRARELDKMLIDAQVIYKNDKFIWEQGDEPKIVHTPAPLGTPRGEKIGAYAIFKREDGTILAREVMAADEIQKVREQSKAPDSLMWKKFEGEGWRKTVIRRGIKSVPVSEPLESIVRRDDENFDFGNQSGQPPAIEGQLVPPRPRESAFQREPEPEPEREPQAPAPQPNGPDGRPEPPPIGETVQKPEPAPERPQGQQTVLPPEEESQEEPEEAPPSEAYMGICNWLDEAGAGISTEKDLEDFKRRGRGVIDAFDGLTDDERDMVRGKFTTLVLTEQQARAKRRK